MQEEREEKAAKVRDCLAKERVKERLQGLQRTHAERKLDLNKCPLLSRPAKEFSARPSAFYNQLTTSSASFNEPYSLTASSALFQITKSNDPLSLLSESQNFLSSSLVQSSFFDNFDDGSKIDEKKKTCLRKLYPLDKTKTQYSYLNILENVADIFTYITINRSTKVMNQTAFRALIRFVLRQDYVK